MALTTTLTMNHFVDTCFLMHETGRRYLLAAGLRFSVIQTVKEELQRLADKTPPSAAACEGLALLQEYPERFEVLPVLPEELDIRRSLPPGQRMMADSVFRRIAIGRADKQQPVHFLTSDTALAEVLGLYVEKITFFDRRKLTVTDWQECRAEKIQEAKSTLAQQLGQSDVVLTSSALRSPFLNQFLQNVQAAALEKTQLPRLHGLSRSVCPGHLSWETLALLANDEVVHSIASDASYVTESALLDALYFARSSGRNIIMLVSGWHDVVHRYDARTRAHEFNADSVIFCEIAPMGDLAPLLNDWRLRKFSEGPGLPFPKAPAPVEEPMPSQPELQTAIPDVQTLPEMSIEDTARQEGPLLAQLVKTGQDASVMEVAARSRAHGALAVLYACRWGKPELLGRLLQDVEELPGYCFDHWFKKSPNNGSIVPREQLLMNDAYYAYLRCVVRLTKELHADSPSVAVLQSYQRGMGDCLPKRAKAILEMIRNRGVEVEVEHVSKKARKAAAPLSFKGAEHRYYAQLVTMVGEMKAADFVDEITKLVRPVDLETVRLLGIKAARRLDRPATISALLKCFERLPAYCFENWFSRTKGSEKSPRARDLLLRKSFYDLTRRIIRMSDNLSTCDAALQTLQNLIRDEDETVHTRALEILRQAEEKGGRLSKKKTVADEPAPIEQVD